MKKEFINHGYYAFSNSIVLLFQVDERGESARIKLGDKVHQWQDIKYARSGRHFVTLYGRRYYFDEIIRCN